MSPGGGGGCPRWAPSGALPRKAGAGAAMSGRGLGPYSARLPTPCSPPTMERRSTGLLTLTQSDQVDGERDRCL